MILTTKEARNYHKVKNTDENLGEYETREEKNLFTITKRDNFLIASVICNDGAIQIYTHEVNKCYSLDENLNNFIEYIEEEETKTPL